MGRAGLQAHQMLDESIHRGAVRRLDWCSVGCCWRAFRPDWQNCEWAMLPGISHPPGVGRPVPSKASCCGEGGPASLPDDRQKHPLGHSQAPWRMLLVIRPEAHRPDGQGGAGAVFVGISHWCSARHPVTPRNSCWEGASHGDWALASLPDGGQKHTAGQTPVPWQMLCPSR